MKDTKLKRTTPERPRLKRTGVLAVLVVTLLAVASGPVHARRTVVIRGGGWGHGIGMSQYGAYGRAERGRNAGRILRHYYSGTTVTGRSMPRRLRVGLIQSRDSLTASVSAAGSGETTVFKVKGEKTPIARGDRDTRWRVETSGTGAMRLFRDGEPVKAGGESLLGDPGRPLVMIYEPHSTVVDIGEKPYDYAYGRLEFGSHPQAGCATGFCVRLVLSIPMQEYLYGLGEVPASWPDAALRAQAVAARTYAFEKHKRTGDHRDPCDCTVYDSTYDQAYIGDAKRSGSGEYWDDWKKAVDGTDGRVILHEGKPIQALYSSSSGGHTENNENVWGGTPMPYLRGVPDRADGVDINPNHSWKVSMPYREFAAALERAYGIGDLRGFDLLKPFGVSGRVTVVTEEGDGGARVAGSTKTVRVSGWSLRSALGLKDTLFRVRIEYAVAAGFRGEHRRLSLGSSRGPGPAVGAAYWIPAGDGTTMQAQDFVRGRMLRLPSTGEVLWQRRPVR